MCKAIGDRGDVKMTPEKLGGVRSQKVLGVCQGGKPPHSFRQESHLVTPPQM